MKIEKYSKTSLSKSNEAKKQHSSDILVEGKQPS